MAQFKVKRSRSPSSVPIEDGSILFDIDKDELFVDVNSSRKKVTDTNKADKSELPVDWTQSELNAIWNEVMS